MVKADPGSVPTAKMEIFVAIAYGSKTCIKELSERVPF